jgi:hypothetical protein
VLEENGSNKLQKRLELLPEEAIYLIERGALFCWKQMDLNLKQIPGLSDVEGAPMSVQQAYSEMIGREDLTLEKFQVCIPDILLRCFPNVLPRCMHTSNGWDMLLQEPILQISTILHHLLE